jgi:hypothetical protein
MTRLTVLETAIAMLTFQNSGLEYTHIKQTKCILLKEWYRDGHQPIRTQFDSCCPEGRLTGSE